MQGEDKGGKARVCISGTKPSMNQPAGLIRARILDMADEHSGATGKTLGTTNEQDLPKLWVRCAMM